MDDRSEFAGMSPGQLLRLGADRFNSGQFFEAHEAWEEVWLESARELRHFYQGLIQVAAAFVHLQRNEYPGTVKLLDEGLRKLEAYPAVVLGVQLSPFIRASRLVEARVVHLGAARLREVDVATLPRVEIEDAVPGPSCQ